MRTVLDRTIPHTDPRLRRRVLHDSESRRYPFPTDGLSIASVEHQRVLPILDQGQVGSCTAEAGFGTLGTAPYANDTLASAVAAAFGSFDQAGAYRLYSAEETLDGDGPYPPQDNGSTGLTCAKVLKAAGLIAGYQHTFSLADALKALTVQPLITGVNWYNSMFNPSSEGVLTVDPASGLAGGHEVEVLGYDQARGLVHFANSWGASWGQQGFFWMQAEDWGTLLDQQGDVTVFVPLSQPAPTPTPGPDDADHTFAAALHGWVTLPHVGRNHTVAKAGAAWLAAKGL